MAFDFGLIGIIAVFGLSATGSALGTGAAAMAAAGAWKRAFLQNRPASFLLVALTGFPLSQTFYGLILMNTMVSSLAQLGSEMIFAIDKSTAETSITLNPE
mgnify:CR=1 FL=1